MKPIKDRKGFTMAELLIVVAIIAVLVAVAIPVFNNQLEKTRESVDLSIFRNAYAAGKNQFYSLNPDEIDPDDGYASFLWDNAAGVLVDNNIDNLERLMEDVGYLKGTEKAGGEDVQIGEGAKSDGRTDGYLYKTAEGVAGYIIMMDIYPDGVVAMGIEYT